jgi:uncharacterized protein (TIGR02266 family)
MSATLPGIDLLNVGAGTDVFIERKPDTIGDERRDAARFRLALALTLVGDHNFYLGVSENVSEGGLFVATHNALAIGEIIELEFTLPNRRNACRVTGEVRWCRSPDSNRADHNNYGSADKHARPGYGIQFKAVSPDVEQAIREFITARAPEFYES